MLNYGVAQFRSPSVAVHEVDHVAYVIVTVKAGTGRAGPNGIRRLNHSTLPDALRCYERERHRPDVHRCELLAVLESSTRA